MDVVREAAMDSALDLVAGPAAPAGAAAEGDLAGDEAYLTALLVGFDSIECALRLANPDWIVEEADLHLMVLQHR